MILLATDIDGVLHLSNTAPLRFEPRCLACFESAVRALPGDTEIVVSSSWREALSLESLRNLFSPDIAARIGGVTPQVRTPFDHYRYHEIKACAKGRPFIVVDDQAYLFPTSFKNLVLVDGECGFDSIAAQRLVGLATAMGAELLAR